jgi:hypothetical protein
LLGRVDWLQSMIFEFLGSPGHGCATTPRAFAASVALSHLFTSGQVRGTAPLRSESGWQCALVDREGQETGGVGCPTGMSRNCWPSAAPPSITSVSNGACSALLRSSQRPLARAVTLLVTVVCR